MGYYAYIRDYDLRIKDLDQAAQVLRDAGFPGDNFVDCLINWGYEDVDVDKHGIITLLSFSDKYRGDDTLWSALAPAVISTDGQSTPYVEWQGEDNDLWRFVFEDGAMHEVGCDIVWPYMGQVRKSPAVVEPLTMGEEATGLLATTIESHIDYLESLRDAGREWYEDRYRQPGSTRPPYPDNIEALIREAKMTLKSVKDAERVVLNVEVLT